jgi:hypothetical protein
VVDNERAHRPASNEEPDLPIFLDHKSTHQHGSNHSHTEQESPLELPSHVAYSLEETHVLHLLGRATPFHIDAEKVRKNRLRDVKRSATEENSKHGDPFHVLPQGAEKASVLNAVSDHGERRIAGNSEDEDDGDVDLKAVDVIVVERTVEEANEEVVEDCEEPGRPDGVVGTNVGHNRDLGGKRNVGEDKGKEEAGEGALPDPVAQGIEDELVATVSIPVVELASEARNGCDEQATYFSQRFSSSYTVSDQTHSTAL